jgi:hypothetical protein
MKKRKDGQSELMQSLQSSPEKYQNIQLLTDWIRVFGIKYTADKFSPIYENNWKYLQSEGRLPENGGRQKLNERMKQMNSLRNSLITTYWDLKHTPADQLYIRRIEKFTPRVWRDIKIISEILKVF